MVIFVKPEQEILTASLLICCNYDGFILNGLKICIWIKKFIEFKIMKKKSEALAEFFFLDQIYYSQNGCLLIWNYKNQFRNILGFFIQYLLFSSGIFVLIFNKFIKTSFFKRKLLTPFWFMYFNTLFKSLHFLKWDCESYIIILIFEPPLSNASEQN